MTKKDIEYSIGLDIGTSSVGWSVIKNDYTLVKHDSKNLWGTRLFDEGTSAADRRLARGSRRRYARRKWRIALLKQLVGKIVLEKDKQFFFKLENGFKTAEDKGYDYNLFNVEGFTDQDYNKKFPTIYHLRKYLCETDDKADPRLIYLALHHIVKYRGHFLYEGQEFRLSDKDGIKKNINKVLAYIFEKDEEECIGENELEMLITVLTNNNLTKAKKSESAICFLKKIDKNKVKAITSFIKFILDRPANLTELFFTLDVKRGDEKFVSKLSSKEYEEDESYLEGLLKEQFDLLIGMKNIYSFIKLQGLMMSKQNLYDAMVEKYESHKKDLALLKN